MQLFDLSKYDLKVYVMAIATIYEIMTLLVGSIFHMTRKIVSEMTYNVSMGMLNPTTIPYYDWGSC